MKLLQLPYVPWFACTSRAEEVQNLSRSALSHDAVHYLPDDYGVLRERATVRDIRTDLSSDFRAYLALHRRGVAVHVAEIMDFTTQRALINKLFHACLQAQPAGCERVNLAQLQSTDEDLWGELSKYTRQGLTPTGTKTFPCDAEVHRLLQSNAIDHRLQPFRSAAPTSANAPASSHERPATSGERSSKMPRATPAAKSKGKESASRLPASLMS
eukprot:4432866-Amphidinium_carterae.1